VRAKARTYLKAKQTQSRFFAVLRMTRFKDGAFLTKVVMETHLRGSRGHRYAMLSHLSRDETAAKMGHPNWWLDQLLNS
jgi:hypothetical protein